MGSRDKTWPKPQGIPSNTCSGDGNRKQNTLVFITLLFNQHSDQPVVHYSQNKGLFLDKIQHVFPTTVNAPHNLLFYESING